MLKLLVSVVAMVPQLAQNPEGALGSLVSGLTGSVTKGLAGGMSGDITNSPIDVISARGVAGNGKVELQQATVRSTIFQADASGHHHARAGPHQFDARTAGQHFAGKVTG